MSLSTSVIFDASAPWSLSSQVSLRDEAFGALAYHHGNRRLVFLKSRELVAILRSLENFSSVDEAIDAVVPNEHDRYVEAVGALVKSDIICGR